AAAIADVELNEGRRFGRPIDDGEADVEASDRAHRRPAKLLSERSCAIEALRARRSRQHADEGHVTSRARRCKGDRAGEKQNPAHELSVTRRPAPGLN